MRRAPFRFRRARRRNHDDNWVLFGLGVGALVVLGKSASSPAISAELWGGGWAWPVPDYVTPVPAGSAANEQIEGIVYPPFISQEWKPDHKGVDIMYKRRGATDQPEYPPKVGADGVANGTTSFFAPPGTPILAARDATVWSVTKLPTGWAVVLDHGKPWSTGYYHLERCDLAEHANGKRTAPAGTADMVTKVLAGDQLGTMGWNPNRDPKAGAVDGQMIRHLHFECYLNGASVDPQANMEAAWSKSYTRTF